MAYNLPLKCQLVPIVSSVLIENTVNHKSLILETDNNRSIIYKHINDFNCKILQQQFHKTYLIASTYCSLILSLNNFLYLSPVFPIYKTRLYQWTYWIRMNLLLLLLMEFLRSAQVATLLSRLKIQTISPGECQKQTQVEVSCDERSGLRIS